MRKLQSGQRIVLKSNFGCEITKINVYAEDQYIVANTVDTFLCGDLETCKLSEVPWSSNGAEKFVFDNPSCAWLRVGRTIHRVWQKRDFGLVQNRKMKPTLCSVRINERPPKRKPEDADVRQS